MIASNIIYKYIPPWLVCLFFCSVFAIFWFLSIVWVVLSAVVFSVFFNVSIFFLLIFLFVVLLIIVFWGVVSVALVVVVSSITSKITILLSEVAQLSIFFVKTSFFSLFCSLFCSFFCSETIFLDLQPVQAQKIKINDINKLNFCIFL